MERTVNSSKFSHHAFPIFKVSAFSIFSFEGQSVHYSIVPCYGYDRQHYNALLFLVLSITWIQYDSEF